MTVTRLCSRELEGKERRAFKQILKDYLADVSGKFFINNKKSHVKKRFGWLMKQRIGSKLSGPLFDKDGATQPITSRVE